MPLQNRVTPSGEIITTPARGTLMGNRGILHNDKKQLGTSRWKHHSWVCCALEFKGRRRELMSPGNYTELFFLDEATALAAGHRPCAECRRTRYNAFVGAWRKAFPGFEVTSAAIDKQLHGARVRRDRSQVRFKTNLDSLPDGVLVILSGDPDTAWLVHGDSILRWSPSGYTERRTRPNGLEVTVLTPQPTIEIIRAGYVPEIHPTTNL
ncbi:MAG: hypothetical protein KDH09_07920 [Chrysiogenetes bacterium]|nr:hypothetical protein [Chrysiogenetes bacterium]